VNRYVNLAGRTDVLALARLLAHSRGVITNDSGPAHLAALVGAKVAVSIGAANISHTVPTGPDAEVMVLSADVSCAPCVKNECPLGTLACLEELDMARASEDIHNLFGL
jgi:heptosyltransferase-2